MTARGPIGPAPQLLYPATLLLALLVYLAASGFAIILLEVF
jgi:hypothetical protein